MFRRGLRVEWMDDSTTDLPNSKEPAEYFGRPLNATRPGALPQARWSTSASRKHSVIP